MFYDLILTAKEAVRPGEAAVVQPTSAYLYCTSDKVDARRAEKCFRDMFKAHRLDPHVHIFQKEDQINIRRHVAVREYLRAHREAAEAYGALKEALARQFPWDLEGYCDGKDSFVKDLEQKALAWWQGCPLPEK